MYGPLDYIGVEGNGDAVEVDDAAANVLRGPKLYAFDADIIWLDAAPGCVEHGWVLADYALLLDRQSARIDARDDGVAPPFLGNVFGARPDPVEAATLDKVAGVKHVQLLEFRPRIEAFRSGRDVARDYRRGARSPKEPRFYYFAKLEILVYHDLGERRNIRAESPFPYWISLFGL